jgi:CRP-like cAMP-binding protein
MSEQLESFLRNRFRHKGYKLSAEILKYCTTRLAKRNELLCYPDESKESFFFVNSGCLRKYIIAPNGIEYTSNIAVEGDCIVNIGDVGPKTKRVLKNIYPHLSEFNEENYVQAIERSKLTTINSKYIELLYSKMFDFTCMMFCLLKEENDTCRRIINMNAKEKYEWLLKCRPRIIQQVPGKIIATYLDISPSTLSRIRSKGMFK